MNENLFFGFFIFSKISVFCYSLIKKQFKFIFNSLKQNTGIILNGGQNGYTQLFLIIIIFSLSQMVNKHQHSRFGDETEKLIGRYVSRER